MLIVANWKAYIEDTKKAKALVAVAKRLGKGDMKIVIAPPAPYLGLFAGTIALAAQDLSDSTDGALTGEITASLLSGLGIEYVILGHSERRAMGETDDLIRSKVQHALAHGIRPILCIGEKERDPEAKYLQFLRTQIAHVFEPLSPKERLRMVIAYEPIWAIGKSAAESISSVDLHEMTLYIRKVLADYIPGRGAQSLKILYGGSVEPANIRDLAGGGTVDGFLVGHASAELATFTGLVKALA